MVFAYVCRKKAPERMCAGIFLAFENVDILFVRHSNELKCIGGLTDWFQKSTGTGTLDLPCCCVCKSSDSDYLVRDAEKYDQELDL